MGTSAKVKLIAHRGNLSGPNVAFENNPTYVEHCLSKGYCVEVDLWYHNTTYTGHDEPTYVVKKSFLRKYKKQLWLHCKNLSALQYCLSNKLHCFFHNNDDVTLTSKGYVWVYPGVLCDYSNSVVVLPEKYNYQFSHNCYGVCSDYVTKIKELVCLNK